MDLSTAQVSWKAPCMDLVVCRATPLLERKRYFALRAETGIPAFPAVSKVAVIKW